MHNRIAPNHHGLLFSQLGTFSLTTLWPQIADIQRQYDIPVLRPGVLYRFSALPPQVLACSHLRSIIFWAPFKNYDLSGTPR